ncbi:hypothetical protein NBZ79_19230 [Sneathiella marina]|uniref:Glycoside hydrolase family 42 N-terminal domain-containing protein n=1 Tax=Sneathiella marina TaxID=2950108 RepID=A0ABY4W7P7_9PROT|nr:hypothetical protein [Sneathiella marina]USG61294.1 hypothetical protein NBZ79_19230 [Sneathiella marina]
MFHLPAGSESAELSNFPKSIFEQDDFFPLAVVLQDPENVERYQKLGINLYVGLWKGPTEQQLARLKKAKMPVMTKVNEVGLNSINNTIIAGWLMQDEPDNAQPIPGTKKHGLPIPPKEVIKYYQHIRNLDPSRPVMLILGQGVSWDQWFGRGVRTNHPEDYLEYVKAGDIVSFDIYPVTHQSPEISGRLDMVPKGVDRLIRWTDGRKPIWSVIGASRINNPDILPTGDEVRRQVWLSIIHGAQGIIYFVHQFKPRFVEAGLLQHKDLSAAVKDINRRITSLAPVLNSAQIRNAVSVEEAGKVPAVTALVKQDRCNLYIFAGSKSRLTVEATFHVKHNIIDQNFTVFDESRSVSLKNKIFQDTFDPYAVHLYQLKKDVPNCR